MVRDPAVSDLVLVLGHALHHRGRARLLLDGVAVVPLAEGVLLEVAVGAGSRVAAIEADRLAAPAALAEAGLAPVVDRLAAAGVALGEDAVDLLEGQALDGVVL